MAELASVEGEVGCGLLGGIFQRRSFLPRKTSVHSLPTKSSSNTLKVPSTDNSQTPRSHDSQRKNNSAWAALLENSNLAKSPPKLDKKPNRKSTSIPPRPSTSHKKNHCRRSSDAAGSSTSSSTGKAKVLQTQDLASERKLRREPTGNSTELSRVITGHHHSNDSKALFRASSGNVMLLGNLGNLRQLGNGNILANNTPNATIKTVDYLHRNIQEMSSLPKHNYGCSEHNTVRQPSDELRQFRGLMNRADPEVLKSMGNEAYKLGRFEEALALYDRAIAVDSNKATYHCNKSAALIGLGHLMEAVVECKEAIRLEPSYHRAHHRLATLYLRLGEAEKTLYHFKHSGPYVQAKDMAQAQGLQENLSRCTEAQKSKEWNTLLRETRCTISSGADSAPLVFALQAEALLKLHRHQEAYATYRKGPSFCIASCTKVFGLASSSYLLMIRAQVYLAAGRFEDAVAAAQHAARLNPSNKEVSKVLKRARAVASARLSGNLLFKASKFSEACVVYSEGLEHEPYNSVLLCNRAACHSKLGQFEKAVEDCTAALNFQSSYSKARLRRANCNAKLERWEAAIRDYEMQIRETPGDEEVGRALFEAKVQLQKQHGEDIKGMKFGSNLVSISSNEIFRHFVTSPGLSVVLFCNKAKNKQVLQIMEQVCKTFPSVNFLKVEVQDHPYLAKSEGVSSIPAFKIYKNGSQVKEVPGNNRDLLESSVKLYSS